MSVKNCHVLIRRGLFSQEFTLIPPSTLNVIPVQKQRLMSLTIKPNSFFCICGEVVFKSQESHCRNLWEDLTYCVL